MQGKWLELLEGPTFSRESDERRAIGEWVGLNLKGIRGQL